MKNFSEKTLIKCVVNMKCHGYLGRHLRCFTKKERGKILDEIIKREWIDDYMNVTTKGLEVVRKNLDLAD